MSFNDASACVRKGEALSSGCASDLDVVSQADAITLRDGDSLAELQAMGVDHPRMTVTADPVFTLNGIPPEQAKKRLLDEQIPLEIGRAHV